MITRGRPQAFGAALAPRRADMFQHLRSAFTACRSHGPRGAREAIDIRSSAVWNHHSALRVRSRSLQQKVSSRSLSAGANVDGGTEGTMDTPEEKTQTENGPPKMVVFGGNGFVGSRICEQGVNVGLKVVSINRSGRPGWLNARWAGDVDWQVGNALEPTTYSDLLKGASAAVSCIGGFGSDEAMYEICGKTNITAIQTAAAAGVKRFVFISVHDYALPGFVAKGYFTGKRDAEKTLFDCFGESGVSLKPSLIHGTRHVGSVDLPLAAIFSPLEKGLKMIPNIKDLSNLPLIGAALLPPVSVESVAKAAVAAAMDPSVPGGDMDVWTIAKYV